MWRLESKWGEMVRGLHNMLHVEANILLRLLDKEIAGLYGKIEREVVEAWGAHEVLPSSWRRIAPHFSHNRHGSLQYTRFLSAQEHVHLHNLYMGIDSVYSELWMRFVRERAAELVREKGFRVSDASFHAEGGWKFSAHALQVLSYDFQEWGISSGLTSSQQLKTVRLVTEASSLSSICINDVPFKVGDWVLARPNDEDLNPIVGSQAGMPQFGVPERMWFGKVKRMFEHQRYKQRKVRVFDVEWHESVPGPNGPYDVRFMSPVIRRGVVLKENPLIDALSVLPLKMIDVKHPNSAQFRVMITKSWLPLSVVNMPVPFPPLKYYGP